MGTSEHLQAVRRPASRSDRRVIQAAYEIAEQRDPDNESLAFMAKRLVQCTLPHQSPGNVPAWSRKNGNLTLTIRPGWDHQKGQPLAYPAGSIPRLLLFWMTTEAARTKSRRLELGDSLAGFMRMVGLDPSTGGGKRGDAARLRDQMLRLFRATISFDEQVDEAEQTGHRWLDMAVAPTGQLWWDPKSPDQSTLFGNWIELGEAFYESIIDSPVPVDMRALRALKQSPLALDLYAFVTYRTYRVSRQGTPTFIPWHALRYQLGSGFTDISNFRKRARAALLKVRAVYPELRIEYVSGGLKIWPSRPAVRPGLNLPTLLASN